MKRLIATAYEVIQHGQQLMAMAWDGTYDDDGNDTTRLHAMICPVCTATSFSADKKHHPVGSRQCHTIGCSGKVLIWCPPGCLG